MTTERSRRDVLFLCVANSVRSQLAEGLGRRLAPPGVEVHSAGSEPGQLNPLAVEVMAERGIDISGHASKPLGAIPSERIGTVVTLCADEVCPIFPANVIRHHWPQPDPAAVSGDDAAKRAAFRTCRDDIEAALRTLFADAGLQPIAD
jgi:protein-tyrosine-phosphatase